MVTQISTNVSGVEVLDSTSVVKIDTHIGQVQGDILVTFFGYLQRRETYWIGAVYKGHVWNVIFLIS